MKRKSRFFNRENRDFPLNADALNERNQRRREKAEMGGALIRAGARIRDNKVMSYTFITSPAHLNASNTLLYSRVNGLVL